MTQTELFPKTELDDANAVLNKLLADEEKAEKACGTADEKLSQIQYLIVRQRRMITRLQLDMPAAQPAPEIVPEVVGEDVVEEAEYERLAIEGDVLDPITGEVVRRRTCPDCDGDGRIPDKTGGGHHGTCATCGGSGRVSSDEGCEADGQMRDAVVLVWRPDAEEPVETGVGEHTTYGELIADFLAENLIDLEIADYRVIDTDEGIERDLNAVITLNDYGCWFRIEPALASEDELAEHEADMAAEPAA